MKLCSGYWYTRSGKLAILERKIIISLKTGETVTMWEGYIKGETWALWDVEGNNYGRYINEYTVYRFSKQHDILNKVEGEK
jgi:hypothetical protein